MERLVSDSQAPSRGTSPTPRWRPPSGSVGRSIFTTQMRGGITMSTGAGFPLCPGRAALRAQGVGVVPRAQTPEWSALYTMLGLTRERPGLPLVRSTGLPSQCHGAATRGVI